MAAGQRLVMIAPAPLAAAPLRLPHVDREPEELPLMPHRPPRLAYRRAGGAVANGFTLHNLTVEEARTLHHARYPALPDMWLPSGWQLSTGGDGIPRFPCRTRPGGGTRSTPTAPL
jgi:hypothetical protein